MEDQQHRGSQRGLAVIRSVAEAPRCPNLLIPAATNFGDEVLDLCYFSGEKSIAHSKEESLEPHDPLLAYHHHRAVRVMDDALGDPAQVGAT